jgi:hypothetical protein
VEGLWVDPPEGVKSDSATPGDGSTTDSP